MSDEIQVKTRMVKTNSSKRKVSSIKVDIKSDNNIFNKSEKVLLISGGTMGHIQPALAMNKFYKFDLVLEEQSKKFFKTKLKTIEFFSYNSKLNFFHLFKSFIYFINKIKKYEKVVVFGGYKCIPAILAATLLGKKAYFHEQNAVLGNSNQLAYRLGFTPLLSFKNTKGVKDGIHFGYPVLQDKTVIKDNNYILITAGSGGSDFFDETVATIIANYVKKSKQEVYMNCKNPEKVNKLFSTKIHTKQFFFNFNELISNASLIIARAGAGTIAQITQYKKPAILIPFKDSVNNHQLENAIQSGFKFLEEKDIDQLPNIISKIKFKHSELFSIKKLN